MFGYLSDFERTIAAMDHLRQRMGRSSGNGDARVYDAGTGWPRISAYDTKDALVLVAEVPGLTEKDLEVTLEKDVLTLAGERKWNAPEGFQAPAPSRFSRSFTLPERLNTDGLTAELKDGVLTVRLPKSPEVQPRKVQIKTTASA
jgi:HSP20 family protein